MIDARDADLLKEIVRRESRSLLQYVGDSFPWTTRQERETLPMLRSMIEEEREAAAALARFLASQRQTPPYLGAFPQSFTTINFINRTTFCGGPQFPKSWRVRFAAMIRVQ